MMAFSTAGGHADCRRTLHIGRSLPVAALQHIEINTIRPMAYRVHSYRIYNEGLRFMAHFGRPVGAMAACVAILAGASVLTHPAQAAFLVTMDQVGSDVDLMGSGSFDLASLQFLTSESLSSAVRPSVGLALLGPASSGTVDIYSGPTTFISFGTGSITSASGGSGDRVGIDNEPAIVFLPTGYTSGATLSDTATFTGATFASLGVIPGTYIWTWGSGDTADSFTLQIGPVPEPASLAIVGVGLAGIAAARRRKRI
jgi:PEP-CTERM motif